MDELILKESYDSEGNIFRSYDWDNSSGWEKRLTDKLVPIIQKFYTDVEGLKNE
jgi:hypothetical protein